MRFRNLFENKTRALAAGTALVASLGLVAACGSDNGNTGVDACTDSHMVFVVEDGDTGYQAIANKLIYTGDFYDFTDCMTRLNGKSSGDLQLGDHLKLPVLATSALRPKAADFMLAASASN